MQKILVVDDERDTSMFLKTILEDEGYKVETAPSGRGGLNKLKRDGFDLVTLDIIMPGMDGWEVLKSIRENKKLKDTPVIVFTIKDTKSDYDKAQKFKAVFITKSSDGVKLVRKVKDILA